MMEGRQVSSRGAVREAPGPVPGEGQPNPEPADPALSPGAGVLHEELRQALPR